MHATSVDIVEYLELCLVRSVTERRLARNALKKDAAEAPPVHWQAVTSCMTSDFRGDVHRCAAAACRDELIVPTRRHETEVD